MVVASTVVSLAGAAVTAALCATAVWLRRRRTRHPPPLQVSFRVADTVTKEHTELVEREVFGSEGVLYRNIDAGESLGRSPGLQLFEVRDERRARELVGLLGVSTERTLVPRRPGEAPTVEADASYCSWFTIAERARGRGVSKRLLQYAYDYYAKHSLERPRLLYGCIEEANTKSLAAASSFSSRLAVLPNICICWWRQLPFSDSGPIRLHEVSKMVSRLKELYGGHLLNDPAAHFNMRDYYVHRNSRGDITAGVQVNPWPVQLLRSSWTFWFFWGLSHMPAWVQPLVKPGVQFHGCAANLLWCAPGHQEDLLRLVVHAQRALRCAGSITLWHPGSPFLRNFAAYCNAENRCGVVGKMIAATVPPVSLVAGSINGFPELDSVTAQTPWLVTWHGL
eukprot:TRINITY_DN7725_c0_g1_i1.p1 TRINITY_DN7725_c0_g1~~TRINITY_DN7725_c0_g1_i1.p1  ORF type:complete len:395 (+),score=91.44 TRINITY_DN7725_c0_g1_i1:209-1393(+)